ncbi:MAG TPA: hypothetical protein ENK88_08780 [Campylobacterales bacterium]|nr:hypothetical protein [Campylobacterales bacterium]
MFNSSIFIWGIILGAIGMGYFTYGKQQRKIMPLIGGVGLFVLPYFVDNLTLLLIGAFVLMALPFIFRKSY